MRTAVAFSVAVAAALLAPAKAQAPALPLAEELRLLGATSSALAHDLPSFACEEAGTSEARHGKNVLNHVAFRATLRVPRTTAERGSLEQVTVTEVNGAPYTKGGYPFPFYVNGGFGQGMRYFEPDQQPCYVYTLRPGRIEFANAADLATHPQCRDEGMHGFALLDASGNITHLERTVSAEASHRYQLVPFSAIDFAPVELNGQIFRLSTHMHAEEPIGRFRGIFDVSYTGCRLFHVSVTVDPGATPVDPAIPVDPATSVHPAAPVDPAKPVEPVPPQR